MCGTSKDDDDGACNKDWAMRETFRPLFGGLDVGLAVPGTIPIPATQVAGCKLFLERL